MSKKLKIILISIGSALVLTALIIVGVVVFGKDKNESIQDEDNHEEITDLKPDEKIEIVYNNVYMFISQTNNLEYQDLSKKEDSISGETKDGEKYVAADNAIIIDKGDSKVKVEIEKNEDKVPSNQIAGAVSKLSKEVGYDKKKKDWNQNYSVYYIEAAECLVYYPKQLKLAEERENLSLLFKDTRSAATLEVTLDNNTYSSMSEVADIMTKSPSSRCLAFGNDWYTEESYSKRGSKKFTTFSYVGLGKSFQVRADLKYENDYYFVFNELKKLIKCRFINDGVWEVKPSADEVADLAESVYVNPNDYDPVMEPTTYYVKDWGVALQYPTVFTRETEDDGSVVFGDPMSGSGILFTRDEEDYSIGEYMDIIDYSDVDILDEYSLRGIIEKDGYEIIEYVAIKNGYAYTADLLYYLEYRNTFKDAYSLLQIFLPGEGVSNMEVTDIYYPYYRANVTLPITLDDLGETDGIFGYRDIFYNKDIEVQFWKKSSNNVFKEFNVVAADNNVYAGEDFVKWHNQEGAYIGVIGDEYAGFIKIPGPNSYEIYKGIWDIMGIQFEKEAKTFSDDAAKKTEKKLEEQLEAQCLWSDEQEEPDDFDPATQPKEVKNWITNDGKNSKDINLPDSALEKQPIDEELPDGKLEKQPIDEELPDGKLEKQPIDEELPDGKLEKQPIDEELPDGKLEKQPIDEELPDSNLEKQPLGTRDDFDDSYDMLLYWEESVYYDLPFEDLGAINTESVVAGEANYLEYEDSVSEDDFNELLNWLSWNDYERYYPEGIDEDEEEYYFFLGTSRDHSGEFHDMMIYLDYLWGNLTVSYFYLEQPETRTPGEMLLSYQMYSSSWYMESDYIFEFINLMKSDFYYIKSYYGSSYMDKYFTFTGMESRWIYYEMLSGYSQEYGEAEDYVDEYSIKYIIEEGTTDGYYFYPEHDYYYRHITGILFEVEPNGELTYLGEY